MRNCDTSLKNEAPILVKELTPWLTDYKFAFPPFRLFLNCIDILAELFCFVLVLLCFVSLFCFVFFVCLFVSLNK